MEELIRKVSRKRTFSREILEQIVELEPVEPAEIKIERIPVKHEEELVETLFETRKRIGVAAAGRRSYNQ